MSYSKAWKDTSNRLFENHQITTLYVHEAESGDDCLCFEIHDNGTPAEHQLPLTAINSLITFLQEQKARMIG